MIPLDIPGLSVHLRLVRNTDADAVASAYRRNREHLAPWEPERTEDFFTVDATAERIESSIRQYHAGATVPWLLVEDERVIGTMTLSRIARGPFQSAGLGYWVDRERTGRGIATAAVAHVLAAAAADGLHRIEASTLLHNTGSQAVLLRSGFVQYGLAPRYLSIAGQWQDHLLFQRILHDH